MSPHLVFFSSEDDKNKIRELFKEGFLPISDASDLLKFSYNHCSGACEDKCIEVLEKEIAMHMKRLSDFEKAKFVVDNCTHPNVYRFSKPDVAVQVVEHLVGIMDNLVFQTCQTIKALENDLYSKKMQLEKRQQKRIRYRRNKKNAKCVSDSVFTPI